MERPLRALELGLCTLLLGLEGGDLRLQRRTRLLAFQSVDRLLERLALSLELLLQLLGTGTHGILLLLQLGGCRLAGVAVAEDALGIDDEDLSRDLSGRGSRKSYGRHCQSSGNDQLIHQN